MDDNRPFLVDKKQPFGEVKEYRVLEGTPCDYGYGPKPLGPTTTKSNHGMNHPASTADKGAGAREFACRGANNPFMWTGK
jgi:hypothetical protein